MTTRTPVLDKANAVVASPTCRFCDSTLDFVFIDLGMSPLCESFLAVDQLNHMEPFYPLRVFTCDSCFLVQLEEYVTREDIFSDYAYFSAYSDTWLAHAKAYVQAITEDLKLDDSSFVMELASNDGYLLQYFVELGTPCLGIEPAANVAEVAVKRGVDTLVEFFDSKLAARLAADGRHADLLIGNNVLAQVPNLNDFVEGMKTILARAGTITMEFPHLLRLIEGNQFDTIYHEHYSYFSLTTTDRIFAAHGLTVFDVDELPTHGGSLRIYARHEDETSRPVTDRVAAITSQEREAGLEDLAFYEGFRQRIEATKRELLSFLIEQRNAGKSVVGYGAPGKGNTLLNYCGIRSDLLEYTVDRNPHKHGMYLPGSHIPIFPPERIAETQPDYVLILPWNLEEEISQQLAYTRSWGAQLLVPIPKVEIVA